MRPPPPTVDPDTDQERIAVLAHQHRLAAVPVVDEARRLLGVVPPVALVDVLLREHDEDIRRLAGIIGTTNHATSALALPTAQRVRNRLPWLLVGLAGSIVAAAVMAAWVWRWKWGVRNSSTLPASTGMKKKVHGSCSLTMISGSMPAGGCIVRE